MIATALPVLLEQMLGTHASPSFLFSSVLRLVSFVQLLLFVIVYDHTPANRNNPHFNIGLKFTGAITYITMGLPIIFLFIFFIRGLTLEGSADGVKAYIGVWDLSVLSERGDSWSTAVSQIFFSLSVCFGISK